MTRLDKPISWYASVYSPERGRQIAKTTSDGVDSTLEYLTDGKVMLHDIETGTNIKVSTDGSLEYRYPNFDGSVK